MKDFSSRMKDYLSLADKGLDAGLVASADALLADSTDIVPFDKGFNGGLASTANKTKPFSDGASRSISVGYNKSYAVRLHEDFTLKIKQRNTSGGQRRQQKFLEKPLKENGKKYSDIIAKIFQRIR